MAATAASAAAIPAADRQVMNKRQTVFGDGSVSTSYIIGSCLMAIHLGTFLTVDVFDVTQGYLVRW